MNELLAYFIGLGLTPEVAAELATKVAKTTPEEPPLANGIRVSPDDAVFRLLTTRYGMEPRMAYGYAGQVLSGKATGSKELQGEALTNVANGEIARAQNIARWADTTKLQKQGVKVSPKELEQKDWVDKWANEQRMKEAAMNQFEHDQADYENKHEGPFAEMDKPSNRPGAGDFE
jgi:hypothetical protein